MKKNYLQWIVTFCVMSLTLLVGCSKDEDTPTPPPTPPITLGATQLAMQSGTATEVTIQGGNGVYQLNIVPQDVVSATVQNGKVLLQALKAGTAKLTFTSLTQQANLVVTVNTLPIVLEQTEISFLEVLTAEVPIQGGNGTFQITETPKGVVSATIQEGKLILKGVKSGNTTITISSGGKQATLSVELLRAPGPTSLSMSEGIYKNREPFFVATYRAHRVKNGVSEMWIAPGSTRKEIESKHHMFHKLEKTVKVGDVITFTFKSKGFPELDGKTQATGKILFIQRNGMGDKAYVKTPEYTFVLPIKE